tara:strand:- start:516 stop:725 length:210 start_codon:yes stop_codon:yes gene_type:complete
MKIKVNGEEKQVESNKKEISLNEAIEILGYSNKNVVVELNNLIVNSEIWDQKNLEEGDKLEIVSIVGGG